MPVRIYEIAKKLGIESKDVLAKAKELGIVNARVMSSTLDRITAEYLEQHLPAPKHPPWCGLKAIGLGNFKAFANSQNVPVRPLTLIFGANSSGKSSVLHGLLLARHAVDRGEVDVSRTEIGGDAVDLGGFRQFVHRREANRRVEWSFSLLTNLLMGQTYYFLGKKKLIKVNLALGMVLDDVGKPVPNRAPCLAGYEIEADGEIILKMSRRPDGTMRLDRVGKEILKPLISAVIQSNTLKDALGSDPDAIYYYAEQVVMPSLQFVVRGLLPVKLGGIEYPSGKMMQMLPTGKGNDENLLKTIKMFFPSAIGDVVFDINEALVAQLSRINYLGPLRSFPARHFALNDDRGENWFAGGGYAWEKVAKESGLRDKINEWLADGKRLQTPYRLVVERLFTGSEIQPALARGLQKITPEMMESLANTISLSKTTREQMLGRKHEIQKRLGETAFQLEAIATKLKKLEAEYSDIVAHKEALSIQKTILEEMPTRGAGTGTGKIEETGRDFKREQQELKALEQRLLGMNEHAMHLRMERKELETRMQSIQDMRKRIEEEMLMSMSEFQSGVDEDDLAQKLMNILRTNADNEVPPELMLMDGRNNTRVSHRDVGIGISQVLPVLVHAYADQQQIVAIEQPEIHLHPALQAELGDLFIKSALGEQKNTFLLETHSEHLILRILHRVRQTTEGTLEPGQTPVRPEDVSVIYVEPTDKGSVVREMPVTPDGDFAVPWPGGFFAERFQDLP